MLTGTWTPETRKRAWVDCTDAFFATEDASGVLWPGEEVSVALIRPASGGTLLYWGDPEEVKDLWEGALEVHLYGP